MRADGLSVVDSTGVLTGNVDVECAWAPPTSTERAPLPGHEHAEPLRATWTDRPAFGSYYAVRRGARA